MIKLHGVSARVRWLRFGLILCFIFVLTGCAKKFLYNNIDWFVLEYLDDYVTFNQEQETLLEEKLLLLADWHEQEELPRYIEHLKELEAITKNDITLSYLQQSRDRLREHYDRIVRKVAPDLFSLSLQLSEKQQREFLSNVQKSYKKRDDKYAGKTEQELREIVFDNTLEWVSEWIGDLSSEQKAQVKRFSSQVVLNRALWRNYRSSIYQELEYLFRHQSNRVIYQKVFMQLLFEPESFYSKNLSANINRNIALTDQLILSITRSMTKKQWDHFHSAVKEWRVLAQELMG